MFCKNCGKEISDNADVCVGCGVRTNPVPEVQPSQVQVNNGDAPNMGFAVLGFFIPLVGLILYLVWKSEYPLKAKSCGKGALIGFCVNIAIYIIYVILIATVFTSALEGFALLPLLNTFAL